MKKKSRGSSRLGTAMIICMFAGMLVGARLSFGTSEQEEGHNILTEVRDMIVERLSDQVERMYTPCFWEESTKNNRVYAEIVGEYNVFAGMYAHMTYQEDEVIEEPVEDTSQYQIETEDILEVEERNELESEEAITVTIPYGDTVNNQELIEGIELENSAKRAGVFIPHERISPISWDLYNGYDQFLSGFYAVDSTTQALSSQVNKDEMLYADMTLEKRTDVQQILIYHTHSLEGFADSEPGNTEDTVVGVGSHLADILANQYGYQVLHDTAQYDTIRDEAYAKSLPALEEILAQNPGIEVIIDLHRDAGKEGRALVTDIDGRKTAMFMLFNGLSYTKKTGNITYLNNPNLKDNLAFSFQMQVAANEYYPGLTRKIYLKGYRYNMHLCPKTLLIELGDENNTVEEAMNACDPIAHLLDLVLTGQNKEQ